MFVIAWAGNAVASDGQALYQRCAACHLPDGVGIPGVFPPLRDRLNSMAADDHGRTYVVMVIIAGLIGPIEVAGTQYNSVMPAQGLTDAQIASILNYMGTTLGSDESSDWQDFSEEEVAEIRQAHLKPTGQESLLLRQEVPALQGT